MSLSSAVSGASFAHEGRVGAVARGTDTLYRMNKETAQIATTGLCSVAVPRRLLIPDNPPLPQSDNKFLGGISEVACQSQNGMIFFKITQIG